MRIFIFVAIYYVTSFSATISSKNVIYTGLDYDSLCVNVKIIEPEPFLTLAIDSVLKYKFTDPFLLEQTYYYINYIKEDSLKENIAIAIEVIAKDITSTQNIAGVIKRENSIFIVPNFIATMAGFITRETTGLQVFKYKEDFIFDGPMWIYMYNKKNGNIRLWRGDRLFPEIMYLEDK